MVPVFIGVQRVPDKIGDLYWYGKYDAGLSQFGCHLLQSHFIIPFVFFLLVVE